MPDSITISDPKVINLIRRVAALKTGGDLQEAVAQAMEAALTPSVTFAPGAELTEPLYPEGEFDRWLDRRAALLTAGRPMDG